MKRQHILLLGAVAGALLGLGAAYVVADRLDEINRKGGRARLRGRPMDWARFFVAVLGLVRQFSRLITPQ